MTRLPSFEALRIFEVAARHGSYSRAADELHVTHSAVSQRIKLLEADLGIRLFTRRGTRMILTPNGRQLVQSVKTAIDEISNAVERIRPARKSAELTVSLLPVMAARWLVPRMSRFNKRHPDISINIKTSRSLANLGSDGVDVAIRFGAGQWKGMEAVKLFDEELYPVCSPNFNGGRLPKKSEDLLAMPLLRDINLPWQNWLNHAGIKQKANVRGTSFSDANLLLEAAIAGQGIALARGSLAAPEISSGRLVRLFKVSLRTAYSHYVVYPVTTKKLMPVTAFRDWLLEEARRS